jgi:membrane fusion protein, multidrug efflux system
MGQETDKGVRESGGKQAPETETGDDNGRDSKSYGSPPAKSPDGKTPDGKNPDGTNLVQEETDSKQEHPERDDPDAGDAPPERRPRRRWGWWVAALVFLGLILLVIYHFRSIAEKNEAAAKAEQQQQAGAAITVGQSKTGDINIYVDALGTVTPISTITLYSQITGQVMAVHYQEGQIVNKGDPLVDIDPRPYEATLKQAQGTLQRDQGVLAQARMDLERYRQALERNAIARQQFEDQQHIVVQNEGTVKTDEATVTYDEVQLSYCHIVSPITGRAGLRLVDPGNTVFAGSASTLVVITQLQPITVVFNVSEDELDQVRAQMKGGRSLSVAAYDRSFDKKIESGKLTSLDNQVDTTTGTVKFRAEFSNPTLALYPNQFVNAQLLLKTLSKVTLVPSAAVQQNGTNAFVYVVQPGDKVAVQQVKVLTNDAANTAVQGLNAGVEVATSGFDRLENGVSVSVRGQPGQRNTQSSGSSKSTSANSKGTSAKKSGK